jgi:hypothetical protein
MSTPESTTNNRLFESVDKLGDKELPPLDNKTKESLTDCELAILLGARARLETAQENYNSVTQTITRFYKLGKEDTIEMTTGEIQRGKKD